MEVRRIGYSFGCAVALVSLVTVLTRFTDAMRSQDHGQTLIFACVGVMAGYVFFITLVELLNPLPRE